jgi:hypothetical protein
MFKANFNSNFHIRTVHLDIIQSFIYSPTGALVSCLKNNIKIYIKIYIETAPTCFVGVTAPKHVGAVLM